MTKLFEHDIACLVNNKADSDKPKVLMEVTVLGPGSFNCPLSDGESILGNLVKLQFSSPLPETMVSLWAKNSDYFYNSETCL